LVIASGNSLGLGVSLALQPVDDLLDECSRVHGGVSGARARRTAGTVAHQRSA
jgi:hypothetical protein